MLIDRIATLALTPPVCVESGDSVENVIEKIQSNKVGCVLVLTGERLAGIITERDVLLKIVARDVPITAKVDAFMTANPDSLSPEDTVGDAVNLMNERRFRHIPIVDKDGGLHGILSVRDVINLIAESFPEQVLNLPPRPHQKMETPEGG